MTKPRKRIGLLALPALVAPLIAVLLLHTSSAAPPAQTPDIAALIARVDQQRLRDHIDAIDEPRSAFVQPAALQAAADYVEAQLQTFGYTVTLDPVTFNDATFPNVIAVHEGAVCPERVFVVGAHYDSVSTTPGADDDASGVAGMLEIARALADTSLPATVWFTGFTMEELGLVGSYHMAQQEVERGTPIVGMFSLEMIGYTVPDADFIAVIGNEASVRLVDSFNRALETYVPDLASVAFMVPGNGETVPDTRRSDHAPFWDAGYQALLVTDTANLRNPNYHQPTDTLDTLDLSFATNVTKAMLATTVDYLTYDGNGDGQPDACAGPLIATATPTPTVTPTSSGTPTAATPTATSFPLVGGIAELPAVGGWGLDAPGSPRRDHDMLAALVASGTVGAVALGSAAWIAQRWHRHRR